MTNGSSTMNDLANLIARLQQERIEAEKQLAQVDEQVRAVETTLHLLRQNGASQEPEIFKSLVSELKGKKQLDAMRLIASKNKGILKVNDAKRLMLEAGLIHNPKNAASILYTLISRSGEFEKVEPGEYKLIGSQHRLSSIS